MSSHQTSLIAALNFLIYSNVWIALAAVSLNIYFYKIARVETDWNVCAFTFAATLFIYNFQRLVKLNTATAFSGDRLTWMQGHRKLSNTLTIVGLTASGFFFFTLDIKTIYVLLPVAIVAIFYVGKFLSKGLGGFRDIPFLKVYFVSIAWVGVAVILPAFNSQIELTGIFWMMVGSIFLLTFSQAIIFDLRDVNLDEKSKRTIPQLIGKKGTIFLAVFCLFFSMTIPLILDSSMWILSLSVIVAGVILIVNVSEDKSDFYFSFFLDGVLILPGLISLFFN